MFYVYIYKDPRPEKNLQPVYVGKGSKSRAWKHWKSGNTGNRPFNDWLTHIRSSGLVPVVDIHEEFEDEASAFVRELELIKLFGRRDLKTGSLFNGTAGGTGTLERDFTPEYRALLAKSAKERDQSAYRTQEFKEKISEYSKSNWQDPAYRARVSESRAATASTESERSRKSAATKAAWADPERKAKRSAAISAARQGQPNKVVWDDSSRKAQSDKMKATLSSPEAKAQRSAAMAARWADPEQREKILAARRSQKSNTLA